MANRSAFTPGFCSQTLTDMSKASVPDFAVPSREISAHRQQAARKLKLACLLGEGGMEEEALMALRDAVLPLGCALAVENRLPEPAQLEETLLAPLSNHWGDALLELRRLAQDPATPWKPVADALAAI